MSGFAESDLPVWVVGISSACAGDEHGACSIGACVCACHAPAERVERVEPLCRATDGDPFCRRHPWSLVHVEDFSWGNRPLWRELERLDGYAVHALPPSPLCSRCGHQLCPCCPLPWCDDLECQCFTEHDGACVVAEPDWKAWQRQLGASRFDDDVVGHHSVTLQLGPWWPMKERQWIEFLKG